MNIQLNHDLLAVRLNGFHAEIHLISDFLHGHAFSQKLENLTFSSGEEWENRGLHSAQVINIVFHYNLCYCRALVQSGLPKNTYYRWLKRQTEGRLRNDKDGSPLPWNKLKPEEESKIPVQARASPELSARQFALKLVDSENWYVSESTVYRVLKKEGLVKPAEIIGFKAGKEYHRKTKRPNELWATDCVNLKVIDWG